MTEQSLHFDSDDVTLDKRKHVALYSESELQLLDPDNFHLDHEVSDDETF